ncbi:hypothetical protein TcWFU_008647 [Taenia crassiceps]|uniref:Bacterial surface antigen (D15) domain-containing protein n=1 Tax=Taenia crassiceps TaxID=6207 RepID=A0ABR4Q984_9CEST
MEYDETFVAEDIPVYVTAVSFIGLGKTNTDFLKKQLHPLVKSKNMRELLENSSDLKSMLLGLQIFKFCEISIDTEKEAARSDAYKVNIFVEEKKPQNLKAQLTVNTDGSMRMGGNYALNNIFRKGERFEIEGSLGSDSSKMRFATFTKPFERNPNIKLSFGGSDCSYDHWWSKILRNESSIFAELGAHSRWGVQRFHWSNAWREVEASSLSTPFNLRLESGVTLKTNLRHSLEIDSRDDRILPQSGVLLRLSEELAFLNPSPPRTAVGLETSAPSNEKRSVQLRLEGVLQKPFCLTDWLIAEATLSAGLVYSLSGHPVSTVDRFFLGGPMELRGYKFYSVGPGEPQLVPLALNRSSVDESGVALESPICPTGGLASCFAGLHLYTPLPFIASSTAASFARLHAFALTGCLLADPVREWRLARASGNQFSSICQATATSVVGAGKLWFFACGMVRLPRSVKIVAHDGRNLDYRVAGSKKSPLTRRWRVIFIGGEKKQATGIVDEQDGFPRWDCEVLIVTPKPVDSVRMLVVDGKEREVGQVIISLADLPWPPAPPPALVTSQLHVRELQPTKHNPIPCGQLSFWIWVLDYWPEGTVPIAASGSTHSKHSTLRGSLSHLGAALKSQQHGSTMATPTGDSHSRLGAKLRDMKNRVHGRGDNGSYVSSSAHQSRLTEQQQQPEEGSVIMGASIISSHPGLGPMGWTTGASDLTGGVLGGGGGGGESALLLNGVGGGGIRTGTKSYNPLASQDEEDSGRVESKLGRTPSLFVNETSVTPALNGRSGEGWNSASSHGEVLLPRKMQLPNASRYGKSRRKVVVEHLRNKLSRSSANLSELGHKIRSRRSSPDGSRCDQEWKVPLDAPKLSHSSSNPPPMRPETRPIVKPTEYRLEPNPRCAEAMVKEEWGLPATQTLTTMGQSMSKNLPTRATYGLHPEEGPGKSKEDMTKRELVELANLLEERLINSRTEVVRLNMEQNELNAQIEELNSELSQTRTNLSNLRNRLLEDNMTQYLEVNGSSPTRNMRSEQLTTFETAAMVSPGATMRNSGGSFLSRARALASKSFGSVIGGSTSQPNLTNPVMMSPRQSISPPSPATTRPGGVDYGSLVWSLCCAYLQTGQWSMTTLGDLTSEYLGLSTKVGQFFEENCWASETYKRKVGLKNNLQAIISSIYPQLYTSDVKVDSVDCQCVGSATMVAKCIQQVITSHLFQHKSKNVMWNSTLSILILRLLCNLGRTPLSMEEDGAQIQKRSNKFSELPS